VFFPACETKFHTHTKQQKILFLVYLGKIRVLYILTFIFLNSNQKDKTFQNQ
jgi:hypothetical protein